MGKSRRRLTKVENAAICHKVDVFAQMMTCQTNDQFENLLLEYNNALKTLRRTPAEFRTLQEFHSIMQERQKVNGVTCAPLVTPINKNEWDSKLKSVEWYLGKIAEKLEDGTSEASKLLCAEIQDARKCISEVVLGLKET